MSSAMGISTGGLGQAMGESYGRFAVENPWHYRIMFGGGFELDSNDAELREEGAGLRV